MLRRKQDGHSLAWLIVTSMTPEYGWSNEKIAKRGEEIRKVADLVGVDDIVELNYPAARLDMSMFGALVGSIGDAIEKLKPQELYIPHIGDVHTDHHIVHKAAVSNAKWFRHGSIKRVLAYETLSETDFGLEQNFVPNVFVDIGNFLEKKLDALEVYASEMGKFPFPRSRDAVRALAEVRGAASGFKAAEAFQLLRERQD
jgi:LmbE family N-acetylglucosaminyl deacetylase